MSKKAKPLRKVALVGTAPSSEHAPINDPSWEIWGVGYRGEHITRATRWYELHRLSGLADGPDWYDLMHEWAKDCEVWMMWPENLGPNIRQFPCKELLAKYGTYFFTSSFAWMLAHAIEEEERVDQIGVWGVDMEYGTEYREQRTGVRHFLDIARLQGIEVARLVNGGLTYDPLPYPFWQDDPLLQKLDLRQRTFGELAIKQRNEVAGLKARLASMSETRRFLNPNDHSAEIAKLDLEEKAFKQALPQLEQGLARSEGTLAEIAYIQDYLKP